MHTQVDVKRVQNRLLEMAKAIKNILESHDIPYFITYGTLLGAVRHQGFIPWDDDFDFYLFDDTYDKAIDLLRKELPLDMFVEDAQSEKLFFHGWAHIKDTNSIAECDLFPQDGFYEHKGISVDLYRTKKIFEAEEKVYRLTQHTEYLDRRFNVGLLTPEEYESRKKEVSDKLETEILVLNNIEDKGKSMYAFSLFYDDRLFVDELFPLKRYQFEDTDFLGPCDAGALLTRCYHNYMELPPEDKRHPHYSSVRFL